MIPSQAPATNHAPWPADEWRGELRRVVTSVDDLLGLIGVAPTQVDTLAASRFPLKVPRPYVARMRRGDPHDPLLRQVLPNPAEQVRSSDYCGDPLEEAAAMTERGLMRKYAGRALLLAAGACAVNCRYCFRRHFPYGEHRQPPGFPAVETLRRDVQVREVILSGGDPLLLTDAHLRRLIEAIGGIGHVTRIRIHTRLPVVIPQRVTAALLDTLASVRQRVVMVLHFNHGNELDADCARALDALGHVTLLNQSVLLRGVNDDADALVELSEKLFAAGVLPYYLHMPDAVAGTAHFDVDERTARTIHRSMAARLPGYLVPKLVRERPGAEAKEMLASH